MSSVTAPPPDSGTEKQARQLESLRFLETYGQTLAACNDLVAVHSSAVHRMAAHVSGSAASFFTYDSVSDRLTVAHSAGMQPAWDLDALLEVAHQQRTLFSDHVLAVPVASRRGTREHIWGVLTAQRQSAAFDRVERQSVRLAGERLADELQRRRTDSINDVLDNLLRKTKPIDVYTHAIREIRRFVPFDHSASVMTLQRGTAQVTVRAEKVVELRGNKETLVDSVRRGQALRLTPEQARFLAQLRHGLELDWDGGGFHGKETTVDSDAAGLWRALTLSQSRRREGAILCYPLVFGGQTLGVLRLAGLRPGSFSPVDLHAEVLERFARLLAVTLYRSELYQQSDTQLRAIKEIGRTIIEPMPVEEVCKQVLQLALRVLHVEVGAVGLVGVSNALDLVAHEGCTLDHVPDLVVGQGIVGTVVSSGKSKAIPNVLVENEYVLFNARVRSELAVPIVYHGEVIGFLDVESYEMGRFREEDEEVISFLEALANQAAIAIKTAQLHFAAVQHLSASVPVDPALSTAGLQDLLIDELHDKVEQLGRANDRLAAANQAKSEFLARMSHDLRGPLNVIVGLANLLTDPAVAPGLTPEKQQESLRVICSSGEVLASLIGNILDLSALEAGKVDLKATNVDIRQAFSYLENMATRLAEDHARELQVLLTVDPSISSIYVDEEKFLRIMINLISNAVKFTASGGTLTVQARRDTEGSGLYVSVRDSGVGIPQEHWDHVFEPFRRLEGNGIRGTGLGLAVVRQLVELHGGRVWVRSDTGAGSHFHVVLPHALPYVDAPPLTVGANKKPAGELAPLPSAFSRGTVLVVEDNREHMDVMRLAVTSRGYTMHGVESAEEGLEWMSSHRPDVILLDVQLPGMDGFSLASELRANIETHSIPIIAVSADALPGNQQRARASGCHAFLTKPIDIAALMSLIDDVTA